MQLSCMESSSGLTAQPLFLWITQANFDNFSMQYTEQLEYERVAF